MGRIRFEFGSLSLDATLLDNATAAAVLAALPMISSVLTWGGELYFEIPLRLPREPGARSVIDPGDIVYWPGGPAIAIGFGRTPISRAGEIRLASPCSLFARAQGDVQSLASVPAGTSVVVSRLD